MRSRRQAFHLMPQSDSTAPHLFRHMLNPHVDPRLFSIPQSRQPQNQTFQPAFVASEMFPRRHRHRPRVNPLKHRKYQPYQAFHLKNRIHSATPSTSMTRPSTSSSLIWALTTNGHWIRMIQVISRSF